MKVTTDACLFGAWVAEQAKRQIATGTKVKNGLDIGAGTGLLSIMLAQKNPALVIDGIEIDIEAYEQAMKNVTASPFSTQITLVNADAKSFQFSKGYDVIVSNPPFYESELSSTDQKKNIAHHQSGLLVKDLLSVVKSVLAPKGIFYFLLPYKRNDEIRRALFEKDFAILKIVFVRQSSGHDYFRMMLSGKLKDENETETLVDEISIWNDQKQYTEEFSDLLNEFYLYL